jgi:hypothetical protein
MGYRRHLGRRQDAASSFGCHDHRPALVFLFLYLSVSDSPCFISA